MKCISTEAVENLTKGSRLLLSLLYGKDIWDLTYSRLESGSVVIYAT